MKVNIVPIGNSKGIRIPKVVLNQCHIKRYVELEVEDEQIVISPYKEKPRQGWEESFKLMSDSKEDNLFIDDNIDLDDKDWVW